MFLILATTISVPLAIFYLLLYLLLRVQAWDYERDNPRERRVLDTSEFALVEAVPQAVAGAAIGLLISSFLLVFGTFAPPGDVAAQIANQAVFVATVETVYLIVFVRTVWVRDVNLGVYLWPLFFSFAHEDVRGAWLHGEFTTNSFVHFAYGIVFGILFYALYALRTHRSVGVYFGPVTSLVAHLVINVVTIVFVTTIAGFTFVPLTLASMNPELAGGDLVAAAVVALVVALVVLVRRIGRDILHAPPSDFGGVKA